MAGAGRHGEPGCGAFQQVVCCGIEFAVIVEINRSHPAVDAGGFLAVKSFFLYLPNPAYPGLDRGGESTVVTLDLHGITDALVAGISQIATWTGIHGGHQQEAGRKLAGNCKETAARAMVTVESSIGCRITPRTFFRNSGNSSRNRTSFLFFVSLDNYWLVSVCFLRYISWSNKKFANIIMA